MKEGYADTVVSESIEHDHDSGKAQNGNRYFRAERQSVKEIQVAASEGLTHGFQARSRVRPKCSARTEDLLYRRVLRRAPTLDIRRAHSRVLAGTRGASAGEEPKQLIHRLIGPID